MAGWRGAEGDSGGLLEFRLAAFLPVERRQLGDLLVGRCWQVLQHVFEIGVRINAVQPAVLNERIHHRAARSGFFGTEKVAFDRDGEVMVS